MDDPRIQILLIEDEAILALDLMELLEAEGYAVVGPARSGARAQELFARHQVDLVLADIHIDGPEDGIQTAARLLAERPVPLIYLTSFADRATLARALATAPAAYLPKPASLGGLRSAIEVALHQFALAQQAAEPVAAAVAPVAETPEVSVAESSGGREVVLRLGENLFVRYAQRFVRVALADVLLLEAGGSHTTLATASGRKYALRLPLSAVLDRLRAPQLVRVHRSFAVNIGQVEAFSDHELTVGGQSVPLGRAYEDEFLKRFRP